MSQQRITVRVPVDMGGGNIAQPGEIRTVASALANLLVGDGKAEHIREDELAAPSTRPEAAPGKRAYKKRNGGG